MSDIPDLESSLVNTLGSDEFVGTAAEAAELGLDAALSDGLLKDVPVVSTLISVVKFGLTIRDRLFANNLLKFLRGLRGMPPEDRRDMVARLEADPAYGRRAGEHLIEILVKVDAHRKPEMIAKVFSAYVAGAIDARTLHRLNNAIERLPFYEIDSARTVFEMPPNGNEELGECSYQALESAGLVSASAAFGGMHYQPTNLCQVFVQLDLDRVGRVD